MNDKIRKTIEALGLTKIVFGNIVSKEGYYIVTVYGGFNGRGNWNLYLNQIQQIINAFKKSYIISINNDPLDDLWVLKFVCYERSIN